MITWLRNDPDVQAMMHIFFLEIILNISLCGKRICILENEWNQIYRYISCCKDNSSFIVVTSWQRKFIVDVLLYFCKTKQTQMHP